MSKIRHYISYPLQLKMRDGALYNLKGIVVHWGSLEHGHYISVVNKDQDG